jgi:teichoic acid transport system permease protein
MSPQIPKLIDVGAVPPLRQYLSGAWGHRDFAIYVGRADAQAHHVDTLLGSAWQLLNPTLLVAIYYLIFGVLFDEVNRGVDNYLGFLVVGVFLFTFTRKSAASGARSIVNNQALVNSVRFPRLLLPIAAVFAELLALIPSLLVIGAVAVLTGEPVTWYWFLVMPLILFQLLFNVGLALIVARLSVHFRDLDELLPFVLRLWFYLSGVLYPVTRIGEKLGGFWEAVFESNPIYIYIALGRMAILERETSLGLWAGAMAWGFGALAVGVVFFRRNELEYGNV